MSTSRHFAMLAISTALVSTGWALPAVAQEGASDAGNEATIVVTGTRRTDRTVADSTVPIDVISADALQNSGTTETNRLLNNLVPSFNFPQPSLTDGTDSLRPATLRGLAPDQVLVLVNGKRRHISSLLNLNGSVGRGSAGVDLNTIPPIAIERIEVLRDGASSQYGSDAIAGVINVQLKKSVGGRAQISYGKYITTMEDVKNVANVAPTLTGSASENPVITLSDQDRKRRDGDTYTMATNIGLPVGDSGYLNFTAEYKDRAPTNRAGPDLRRNYGALGDPRETSIDRYWHRFGDGESKDLNFFYNAGMDVGADWELYSFGSYGVRDGNGAGFYRRALDARNADWDNGGAPLYVDGYLPYITSEIRDIAATAGLRGAAAGWNLDLSVGYGSNRLDYGVENSVNVSLGGDHSPRKFNAGGMRYGQTAVNFDAQRDLDLGIGSTSLALGAEWRNENYKIVAGEPASYAVGPYFYTNGAGIGSQVFGGFMPSSAVDKSRDSFAGYVEVDTDISDMFNVQAAGRYEHFSDFGDTVNGKIAARFEPVDGLALRGSVSTGFRAPGMAQQYFSTTSTVNLTGVGLVEVGTFPVASAIARALGSEPLKPEKSLNFGGGLVFNMVPGLNVTVDYYRIKIKDRITLTENLQGADVAAILQAANIPGSSARFFINGIDTRTQGLDVVASYRLPDMGIGKLTLTAGYNLNETKITDRRVFSGFTAGRLFARAESLRLTDGQPSNKLNVGLDWESGPAGLTLRGNRYGSVFIPGPSGDITIPKGAAPGDLTLSPKWVVDLEARFRPVPAVQLAVGANNLLDEYPDRLPYGVVGGYDYGLNNSYLPYSSFSPFGFSGRFVYGRVSVDF
jgi:iron complex outermembrane receptor protein